MKLKKKIDTYSLDDLQMVQALSNLLIGFGVKSAEDLYYLVDEIADKEFCGECERHKDDCMCRDGWAADDDGDRAYDEWKDAQLENKHNKG